MEDNRGGKRQRRMAPGESGPLLTERSLPETKICAIVPRVELSEWHDTDPECLPNTVAVDYEFLSACVQLCTTNTLDHVNKHALSTVRAVLQRWAKPDPYRELKLAAASAGDAKGELACVCDSRFRPCRPCSDKTCGRFSAANDRHPWCVYFNLVTGHAYYSLRGPFAADVLEVSATTVQEMDE